MMPVFIRAARVIDTASAHHNQVVDVLVEGGIIRQVGPEVPVPAGARLMDVPGLHLSPGWVDGRAAANDPGHEYRETLPALARAAAAGGFTDVLLLPHTSPPADTKDTLGYLRRQAEGLPARLHPMAAITKGMHGLDFTDMIDLHRAGAVAFTDGDHPLTDPDLLLKTLQYLRPLNALLVNRPQEPMLTRFGQMHEGVESTRLGMKGLPAIAEVMMVERDLRLLAHALEGQPPAHPGPVLHMACLSVAESVALVRQAKAAGLPVSCDVAAHQLVFTDTNLAGFDTYLKVNPPFRTPADIDALWAGLADGTIDMVVSDHHPHDEESKNCAFDLAEFGISGIETVFAALMTHHRGRLALPVLLERLTAGPRRVLGLPPVCVAEGQPAALTLFDPAARHTYDRLVSSGKNSPFLGQPMTGTVLGTLLPHCLSLNL